MDHVDGKIWYAFLGAPVAWSLQLIIGYAMVAHACYPSMDPLNFDAAQGTRITAGIVTIVTLIMAIAALVIARQLVAAQVASEGVARYLSKGGVLIGIVFSLLIVFNLLALIIEPTCRFA